MDRLLWLVLAAGALGACLQLVGDYTVNPNDDGSGAGHPTASCHDDGDCSNGDGCDHGGRCRKRCVTNGECPGGWSHCNSSTHLCSMFPGEPCDSDYDSTCGQSCLKVDSKAQPVAPYCSADCIITDGVCPPGFVCTKYDCYKIAP